MQMIKFSKILCLILPIILFGLTVPTITYSQDKSSRIKRNTSRKQIKSSSQAEVSTNDASNKQLTTRQIVERVLPAVVLVVAEDENGQTVGQGSGFFYKSGLVATNLHVFTRASRAHIKVLNGGATYKVAEVVGIDMRHDLCVVRIDDVSTKPLTINASNKPAIGDEVYVASNPKGLEGSFSKGIVSSIRNSLGLIQIDAAISPGSSGGAVVNTRAEVIGVVVSSIISGQNLNFAIPVEYLNSLKLNFKVPVVVAGAFSLKDRAKEKLKGLVRNLSVTRASYDYDQRSDKYFEKPAELAEQSKYDLDGNKIELWQYLDGKLMIKHFYTYDEQGFKTRHILEFKDGSRKEYEITLAQSMTEKLDERMYSGTSETPISQSTYDRYGNEIEQILKLTYGLQKHVFTYGRHGFVAEEKTYLNDVLESVSRFTYETDDNGNWIKRYENGFSAKYSELGYTPVSMTYREITYHNQ